MDSQMKLTEYAFTRLKFPGAIPVFISAFLYATFLHWKLGMDGFWDSANYHFYIGWAAFQLPLYKYGAAAAYQSYLNPIIDILNYFSFSVHPFLGALVHALALAVAAVMLSKIYLWDNPRNFFSIISLIVVLAIGLSSAMTVSLFGSLTNEHIAALPILGALYLLVRNVELNSIKVFCYIGLLTGVALGLKLTVAHYAVGIICAVVLGTKVNLKILVVVLLSAGVGFILIDGIFMYARWVTVDNPIFPFANNIFQSSYYPKIWKSFNSFEPNRFYYYFSLPFIWLHSGDFSESPIVRDGRILTAYIGIGFLLLKFFVKGVIRKKDAMLIAFFLSSWITWICVFRIYRYLVVLEMISSVIFVIGVNGILEKHKKFQVVIFITVGVFMAYVTVYPDWGRREWSNIFYKSDINELLSKNEQKVIFFADERLSYLAPELKRSDTTFKNIFSQSWWDGDRNGNPLDTRSFLLSAETRTYFLQYLVLDPRFQSPYLKKIFPDDIYVCALVTTNLIWNPHLCVFQKPAKICKLCIK